MRSAPRPAGAGLDALLVAYAGLHRLGQAHPATDTAYTAERAAPAMLHGNCTTAASVHATLADADMALHAAVFAPDGHACLRTRITGSVQQPEEVSHRAAEQLPHDGAAALLHALPGRP
ncbi:hypothetical protein B7P34_00925 [Streptosporangium nondiastaticum]|uniref:Porphobilinogen deaminase C-terminal domain-containing protein n=1 Tax=Streptosporangium nondiastaticum TaxID=35764 RepID=A0A9X7JVA2_9ACTN|nr:hypothetical protein [Streptosporangium nondiastaticum]PSJ30603.1 hypothetical protein B7P34_00925 [Streptosporangium nondiastaticum]